MIDLICLSYSKCNNLIFKINNKTLGSLFYDIAFLAIN